MYSRWNKPENEQRLIEAVQNNTTIAGVCRELGLKGYGGNIATIRNHIVRLGLDVSHHVGQKWATGKYIQPSATNHKRTLRAYLIREYGHACWICKLDSWLGNPIPLEMDHIDGDNTNNEIDNLRMLCHNCHALTPTFRNNKRASIPTVEEPDLNPGK